MLPRFFSSRLIAAAKKKTPVQLFSRKGAFYRSSSGNCFPSMLPVRCVPFQPLVLGLKDCFDYRLSV
jgi:hypothetical protein